MNTVKVLSESMLTNIVEDDYAFYVHPDMYISINKFNEIEKKLLLQLKNRVLEETKGTFTKWSISQRARWLSKYCVVMEGNHMCFISRKRVGDWHHIFKDMISVKHKMQKRSK